MFNLEEATSELRAKGIYKPIAKFDPFLVRDHLRTTTVYNAHVQAKATASLPFQQAVERKEWQTFCHSMQDIVLAPRLLEITIHGFLPLAQAYFGEPPLLYSMNCFWTQPGSGPQYQDTHSWHRDGDDRKQMVAFFVGEDITEMSDGGHLYQAGSHDKEDGQLGYDWHHPPGDKVVEVRGAAGTIFVEDTRGLHMAYRPARRPRMLAWARFGVTNPPVSYFWDKLAPVDKKLLGDRYPSDPVIQQAIQLVVK